MGLFFPRRYGNQSLDQYDCTCILRLLDDLVVGEEIKLFVPNLNAQHTITKCSMQSEDGEYLWRASWDGPFEEPSEQSSLCSELFDIFEDEESLWVTEDALLRPSEYLALPQPRPKVWSISMLNGAVSESVAGESDAGESKAGESEAGESEAGESEAGESEAGESEAGESEAGESEAGESEAGKSEAEASDFNFPVDAVTVELRKGRGAKLEGTFTGRAGDKLGVWDSYLRFDADAECSPNTHWLWRGDFVSAPGLARAVFVRILGASKAGGNRSSTKEQSCYVCLLYRLDTSALVYATMPNVTPVVPAEKADATLMASIESMLHDFTPKGVSAALSDASRAASSKKTAGKKHAREEQGE